MRRKYTKNKMKMKKVISLFLVIIMIINGFPNIYSGINAYGANWDTQKLTKPKTDSQGNFLIGTASELSWLANEVNNNKLITRNVLLTSDIDLSGNNWIPIGIGDTNYYQGTFNGNYHKISGMSINTSEFTSSQATDSVGLFGKLIGEEKSIIKNLTVEGTIIANGDFGFQYIGGIAGQLSGNIINCRSFVDISTSGDINTYLNSIGVSGENIDKIMRIGGIAGKGNNSNIINCYENGTLLTTCSNYVTGKIIGTGVDTALNNCIVLPYESQSDIGIDNCIGSGERYTEENCSLFEGNIIDKKYNADMAAVMNNGLLALKNTYGGNISIWGIEESGRLYLSGIEIDKDIQGLPLLWTGKEMEPVIAGGTIYITTPEELAYVSKKYLLGEGQSLEGSATKISIENDLDLAGALWTPIGSKSNPCGLEVVGNNHIIKNMVCIGNYNELGLFGTMQSEKGISDLVVSGVVSNTNVLTEAELSIGGILGYAKGNGLDDASFKINRCASYVDIYISANTSSKANIGGILGVSNNAAVSNSYYVGKTISGSNTNVYNIGGITGYIESGKVSCCYTNNSDIYGDNSTGLVEKCYAISNNGTGTAGVTSIDKVKMSSTEFAYNLNAQWEELFASNGTYPEFAYLLNSKPTRKVTLTTKDNITKDYYSNAQGIFGIDTSLVLVENEGDENFVNIESIDRDMILYQATCKATINGVGRYYTHPQVAYNQFIQEGNPITIKLIDDIIREVDFSKGGNITLDLNGFDIHTNGISIITTSVTVGNETSIVIKNDKSGDVSNIISDTDTAVKVTEGHNITLENVTVKSSKDGIYVEQGSLTLNNAKVSANKNAIIGKNTNIVINGGKYETINPLQSAGEEPAAVRFIGINGGKLEITNGDFISYNALTIIGTPEKVKLTGGTFYGVNNSYYSIDTIGGNGSTRLCDIVEDDYTCYDMVKATAINESEVSAYKNKFKVLVKMEYLSAGKDATITYGDSTTLTMNLTLVKGLADQITYSWYMDGEIIDESVVTTNISSNSYVLPKTLPIGHHTFYCVAQMGAKEVTNNLDGNTFINVIINPKDINKIRLSLISNKFIYDGYYKYPEISISNGDMEIIKDRDYSVEYLNNLGAGEGSVIVKGLGNYTGSKTLAFTIGKQQQTFEGKPEYVVKYETAPFILDTRITRGDGTKSYESSNELVAVVDSVTGQVKVVGAGEAQITVKAAATKNYSEASTVVNILVEKQSQIIQGTSKYNKIYGDEGFILDSKLVQGDGSLTFASSNTKVAQVNKITGKVTITGVGRTVITAAVSENDNYKQCNKSIVIYVSRSEQILRGSDSYIRTYGTSSFLLNTKLEKGDGELIYESSNSKVVLVDRLTGKVSIKGVGNAEITIKACESKNFESQTKIVKITIVKAYQNLAGTSVYNIRYGDGALMLDTILAKGDGEISYKSSNEEVAKVIDKKGTLSINGIGTTVITIDVAGNSNYYAASTTVTVNVSKGTPKINGTERYERIYGTASFVLDTKLIKGDGTISYKSSNSSAIEVDKSTGKIKINKIGAVTITAYVAETDKFLAANKKISIKIIPPMVTGLRVTENKNNSISLSWNGQKGITGYKIYSYNPNNKKYTLVKTISNYNTNKVTLKYLKSSTTYRYSIRAYKRNGTNVYASSYSSVVTTSTTPGTVSMSLLSHYKSITVKWKAIPGTGYEIQYSTRRDFSEGTTKTETLNVQSQTYETIRELVSGKKYYVRVRAIKKFNSTKINGKWSQVKSIKVK